MSVSTFDAEITTFDNADDAYSPSRPLTGLSCSHS